MTLELQIRESVIAHAITQWVQTRLFTQCVPTPLPVIVDHLDSVPDSVAFIALPNKSIAVSLAVRVFVVLEPDLRATPGAPASHPVTGDIVTQIILGIRDRALVILDATAPSTAALPAEATKAVDDPLADLKGRQLFDLAPIVTALEAQVLAEPDLALRDNVLALRLGAAGAFTPHLDATLTPPHDWGVFLDVDQTLDLLRRRIPPSIPVQLHWQSNGADPAIGAAISYPASTRASRSCRRRRVAA